MRYPITKLTSASLAGLLIGWALMIPVAARADLVTMTLTGVGNSNSTPPGQNTADGGYTYPYFFSVVDQTSSKYTNPSVALICDDYSDDVGFNESWTANTYSLQQAAGGSGQMQANTSLQADGILNSTLTNQQAYWAAAYLFQQLVSYGLTPTSPTAAESEAFNVAIWGLFSNQAYTSNPSAFTNTYNLGTLGSMTVSALINSAYTATKNGYSNTNIVFYTPTTPPNITNACNGCSARPQEYIGIVPEPASMFLLGIGLIGLFGIRRGSARYRY